MFYYFTRFLVRLALPIFLRRLCVVGQRAVPSRGPVLLASNHPDSFFDAVVVGSLLPQPIHTLTRGDVFRKPKVAFWLRQIHLIPVFRGSEGRQYVQNNRDTFDESLQVMQSGEAVLVFSEGLCINEWRLRPLGKGTARMAYQSWYGAGNLTDLVVVPVGLTYEHYRGTGKRVKVNFGDPILPHHLDTAPADYEKWLREFNNILADRIRQGMLELPAELTDDEQIQHLHTYFADCPRPAANAFTRLVGSIGRAIHRPLYRYFSRRVATRTAGTVFYDSVLFGLLLYLYPVLVLLLALIVGLVAGGIWGLAVFIGLPLLAWAGNRYR
ncbi:1-acyl-sn-glycerol-3-phosphate acyltransferase [Telluribacter humicola]|uniref:1-acyl-sn-glycerol-3-phosphate acyltransferase n=1 Tax=Telluribacter humicola TaxID=1720261 RepID=UPI001A96ED77|nr:1-acyl-sn-glycerol-3-phosphate acyltransferase [Telluribacter humicola]